MAKTTEEKLKEVEGIIDQYEKKFLTPEKIKETKQIIKMARGCEVKKTPKGFEGNVVSLGYGSSKAFISPSGRGLNMTNDVYCTTEKLVIADDYAKQGREGESYALLGNAYELFKEYGASRVKGEEAANVYNAIGKRALKYAKNVAGKNLELAKNFLQLAKECEAAYGKAQKSK